MPDGYAPIISSSTVERLRRAYVEHLDAGRDAEEFAPERMRPATGLDFAFIGGTPRRKGPSRFYRCSFCQTERKFSTGKVVLSADGRLRLIGPECWDRYFDDDTYRARKSDLEDYELRTAFATHGQRIAAAVEEVLPNIRDLAYSNPVLLSCAAGLPAEIRADTSGFGILLRQVRPGGGMLTVERYIPDERHGKDERGRYLRHRPQSTLIHRIAGLEAAFTERGDLVVEARAAYATLKAVLAAVPEVPSGGENAPAAKAIRALQRQLVTAMGRLRLLRDAVEPVRAFLARENLLGIVRWSRHDDCDDDLAGRIEFSAGTLSVEGVEGSLTLVVPPALEHLVVPDLDEVSRLLMLI